MHKLYNAQGAEYFVHAVCSCLSKYDPNDINIINSSIKENYANYTSVKFCESVCDYISRSVEFENAVQILKELFQKANKSGKRGVFVGADVLWMRSDKSVQAKLEIDSIYSE